MAGYSDGKSHLIDLSTPAPVEPTGKHTNELHRDRRAAFPAAAAVSPPRSTAERKRINTGVPSQPVVLPQNQQPTHLHIGSNLRRI